MAEDIYILKINSSGAMEKEIHVKLVDDKANFKTVLGLPTELKEWIQAYSMFSDAGTFNGKVATTASSIYLADRYYVKQFVSSVIDVIAFNHVLPNTYKGGSDIKFMIHWTANSTTGNARLHLGMTQLSDSGKYASDTDTEYVVADVPGPVVSGYVKMQYEVTFDGTGLVAGDPLSFIIMREGPHANDTLAANSFVNGAIITTEIA